MATTASSAFALSDRELMEISERNPGFKIEALPSGVLIMSPTSAQSGILEAALIAQVFFWAQLHGGLVFSSNAGFRLPNQSVRCPDASWVSRERWNALTEEHKQGFSPICPDAVFELASPSDSLPSLRKKMNMYIENGARIAVLLDPRQKLAEIHRPGLPAEIFHAPSRLSCEPEMPGFFLDCLALFQPAL